jgi:hypothetical protein
MRRLRTGSLLAVLLLAVSSFAADQPKGKQQQANEEQQQDSRLRVQPPIVVNVEGKMDRVETDQTRTHRSVPGRLLRGVAAGSAKVWNGVIDLTGKILLNVDQDVPSERERQRSEEK